MEIISSLVDNMFLVWVIFLFLGAVGVLALSKALRKDDADS